MRIIYIGDFRKHYATENYIAYAFECLGVQVIKLEDALVNMEKVDVVVEELINYSPDFILFSKRRPKGQTELVIEKLKERGIKTVCWLFDIYIGFTADRLERVYNKIAPLNCEYIISTDGGHDKEWAELGYKHFCVRQGIHEPEAKMIDNAKDWDVIFIGTNYIIERGLLMARIKNKFKDRFKWLGTNGDIRGMELNEIIGRAKIVIGDSFPSKNYWSNRVYEILGRGGFLIHPYVEGLEKEFEIGKHLVCYKHGDADDLIDKINYYLEHPEEREKIKQAGFEFVKNNYTYQKRCKQVLEILK